MATTEPDVMRELTGEEFFCDLCRQASMISAWLKYENTRFRAEKRRADQRSEKRMKYMIPPDKAENTKTGTGVRCISSGFSFA